MPSEKNSPFSKPNSIPRGHGIPLLGISEISRSLNRNWFFHSVSMVRSMDQHRLWGMRPGVVEENDISALRRRSAQRKIQAIRLIRQVCHQRRINSLVCCSVVVCTRFERKCLTVRFNPDAAFTSQGTEPPVPPTGPPVCRACLSSMRTAGVVQALAFARIRS
jgi:hypothetical protein